MEKHIQNIFNYFRSRKQTEEAKQAFHVWLVDSENQEDKNKALKQIWDEDPNIPIQDTWTALYRIKEYLQLNKRNKMLWAWKSVAAVLLLASASLIYILFQKEQYTHADLIEQYTPIASVNKVILPDGTEVYTNSKTILLYPNQFTGKSRSVYLVGEAMFKVARDEAHPFIVKTSNVNVTALGTEFNVEAYSEDDKVYATLLSGSIKVEKNTSDFKKILVPNERIAISRDTEDVLLSSIDPEIATAWIDGEVIIQNKTLKEVFTILERHYDLNFNMSRAILNNKYAYTFKFKRNAPFDEVTKVLKAVANIDYRVEDNNCYIY